MSARVVPNGYIRVCNQISQTKINKSSRHRRRQRAGIPFELARRSSICICGASVGSSAEPRTCTLFSALARSTHSSITSERLPGKNQSVCVLGFCFFLIFFRQLFDKFNGTSNECFCRDCESPQFGNYESILSEQQL